MLAARHVRGAEGAGLVAASTNARTGFSHGMFNGSASSATATFGLVATILGCLRFRPELVPYGVGLFITAGYWFTSSTSFANPAVTIARSLTDTFSGSCRRTCRPSSSPS